MILGPDGKRLSKRHGATDVEEFRALGYAPEAVVNYLALLGWSYDDRTEIMSVAELVERFSLERVQPSPAVFDHQKLAWMNGVHLRGLAPDAYATRLRAHLAESGSPLAARDGLDGAVPLVQEKIGALGEFEAFAGFLFRPAVYEEAAWERLAATPRAAEILGGAVTRLEALERFDAEEVEAALRGLLEELGLKPRTALTPVRVALSGRTVAPGLFESAALLGREETLGRLRAAHARLQQQPVPATPTGH
jgi:glutamyl-tRNA synthetase